MLFQVLCCFSCHVRMSVCTCENWKAVLSMNAHTWNMGNASALVKNGKIVFNTLVHSHVCVCVFIKDISEHFFSTSRWQFSGCFHWASQSVTGHLEKWIYFSTSAFLGSRLHVWFWLQAFLSLFTDQMCWTSYWITEPDALKNTQS